MVLLIGIIGLLFILIAFVLDEFYKKFNQNTVKYNILNVIGSGLLGWYAYVSKVWPFLILNILWFVVALLKLLGILKKREYVTFNRIHLKKRRKSSYSKRHK